MEPGDHVRLIDNGRATGSGDLIYVYAEPGTPGSIVAVYPLPDGRPACIVDFDDGHESGKPLRQHVLMEQLAP